MPRTPIDFSKGLIYSIVCKTDETLIYIGSTTNFTKRKTQHKSNCHNENKKDHNYPVYVMIRANGGWDNFDMKPVKEYPCENNIQLTIEEERVRKELQATLNTNRAFLSEEEEKERYRKYYEANTAEINKRCRKYYEANTAEINKRQRKYREEHKAELKEYKRKYAQEHKDERNKKRRENRLAKKNISQVNV
jgi:hypothetical protein